MIFEDRMFEMQERFLNETAEDESKEWRDSLSKEELELVKEWDKSYSRAITLLYDEMNAAIKNIKYKS